VSFTLPIFQQWFAAQALLGGVRSLESVLESAATFDRWRWSIAIAASDAPSHVTDNLIQSCLEMNPGAGAWIIDQVSAGRSGWRNDDDPPIDVESAPARLLLATRSWIDAVGPLASMVLPVTEGAPIRLGVRVDARTIDTGWTNPGEVDEVVELPPHVHPFGAPDPDWIAWRAGGAPDGDIWPWRMVRDDIARQTARVFDGRRVLGPIDGIWHQERRYLTARIILRKGSVFQPPLDRSEIIDAAEALLRQADDPSTTLYHLGPKKVGGDEVIDLRDWLQVQEFKEFARPVPGADLTKPAGGGGMIWDLYTREHMLSVCAEMMGLACQAYDELVETLLPTFDWSLGRNAYSPMGTLGFLSYQENGVRGFGPTLEFKNLPMDLMAQDIEADPTFVIASNGRAAVRPHGGAERANTFEEWTRHSDRINQWAVGKGIDSPFRSFGGVSSTVVECSHDRPASFQAARWAWNDLKRLSLVSGSSPQLRS
jgi:hypothetical protein